MNKVIILVIIAFTVILVGCSLINDDKKNNKSASQNEKNIDRQVTEISVYVPMAATSSVVDGWISDIILEELGIKVNIIASRNEKKDIDIIITTGPEQAKIDYVDTGKVLEWDEDLLSQYGDNISTYCKGQLDYFTEVCDGRVYGFARHGSGNGTAVHMISKESKKQIEAMKFLNWLANPENMVIICTGPKDLCWGVDEEGYYYLTEFGRECVIERNTIMPGEEGMKYYEGILEITPNVWHFNDINPLSAHGETFNYKLWEKSGL